MRTYVAITGVLFATMTLIHLWRIYEEGAGMARQPFFVIVTVLSTGLAIWAWRLLRERRAS